MSEVLARMKERRSIRKYKLDMVPQDITSEKQSRKKMQKVVK